MLAYLVDGFDVPVHVSVASIGEAGWYATIVIRIPGRGSTVHLTQSIATSELAIAEAEAFIRAQPGVTGLTRITKRITST
jgi:hypothetical protein